MFANRFRGVAEGLRIGPSCGVSKGSRIGFP